MTITITVPWGGPADCSASSNFKIERTLDGTTWSILAASQTAASPYISPSALLSENVAYNSSSVGLSSTSDISDTGYGMIEDANIIWTGKSASGITGVTWNTGYGTYVSGSTTFYETNQTYTDVGVSPSSAVLYRITHYNSSSLTSGYGYYWYYNTPAPDTRDHCVVIFHLLADLGFEVIPGASITSYLTTNDQVADDYAAFLHYKTSSSKTTVTNAFGIAYGQYYKSNRRTGFISASDSSYTFEISACGMSSVLTSASIPDRDWVFFKDIIT